MDTTEQQKSDGSSLSTGKSMHDAMNEFVNEGKKLLDDDKSIEALRKFVEGFLVRYEKLMEENATLRYTRGTAYPSDEAKFNILQQFEHDQATLVETVNKALDEAMAARREASNLRSLLDMMTKYRDNAEASSTEWYEKQKIQEAANLELLRKLDAKQQEAYALNMMVQDLHRQLDEYTPASKRSSILFGPLLEPDPAPPVTGPSRQAYC